MPAVDLRGLRRREWRGAGAAALVVHAVMLGGIIVIGKLALATFVPVERAEIIKVGPSETTPPPPDAPDPGDGGGKTSEGPPNEGAAGGGSNTDPAPVTRGEPPRSTPTPPIPIPAALKPIPNPALPVDPAIQGPKIDIPTPTAIGQPDAPPAPDDPSAGNRGGTGVGDGSGPGGGSGDGPGRDGNPGDRGGGGRPGGVGDRNGPDGPGTNPFGQPGAGVPDHGPRLIKRVKPTITKAMLENGTFGTVQIRVTVGADGRILSADPISSLGNGGTQAALDALYRCKFEPAVRNQRYVTESTVVRFEVRPN